nr:hypothetical protein [uncultured bacterium]
MCYKQGFPGTNCGTRGKCLLRTCTCQLKQACGLFNSAYCHRVTAKNFDSSGRVAYAQ